MTNSKSKSSNNNKEHPTAMANVENRGRVWLDNGAVDSEESDIQSECDEEEEEDDADTCSSFSLQECIDEFRARRIRRISTQSREYPILSQQDENATAGAVDEDVDLVEQNRSNKEQERKCKPCKNGFCYCFTSDSGDGGCSVNGGIPPAAATATRAAHMRRSRKSENMQLLKQAIKQKDYRRRSAPATYKAAFHDTEKQENSKNCGKSETITTANGNGVHLPLTAISRLETSSNDAPLIHIIQELHNNCVISEVRVNKDKIEAQQRKQNIVTQTVKQQFPINKTTQQMSHEKTTQQSSCAHNCTKNNSSTPVKPMKESHQYQTPSAPPLETISEIDSAIEALEMCKLQTQKQRSKYGGRLLRKRLSYTGVAYKPKDFNKPPRKPPRIIQQCDGKHSDASTSPSVRNAKRVIDEFLIERGVTLPTVETIKHKDDHKAAVQRKSYPLTTKTTNKTKPKQLRTYPSLSDFENFAEHKLQTNYDKNISSKSTQKPMKEITLGWAEPKISEMLNCDTNGNRREFKSQSCQAEPQAIGWQIPPKLSLDTVDGPVQQNLATNIKNKDTPVKSPQVSPQKSINDSTTKFLWGEQLRNLSPFSKSSTTAKPKSNLKSASSTFLNTSKKKILRLVTPKKDNKAPVPFVARKTPLRSIGIQTSHEDLQSLQSPPGSYHSTAQNETSSAPTTPSSRNGNSNLSANASVTNFDFNRTVRSPPKKQTLHSQRKLNFPLNCAAGTCVSRKDSNVGIDSETTQKGPASFTKTYRSFNTELDQDLSLSKMNYILGNIRARLEASDDHAMRTFQEIERRELQAENSVDYTDGAPIRPARRHSTRAARQQHDIEPIYSEIEEDSIHITASPQFDNKTGTEHFSTGEDPSALYAKVNKTAKQKSKQHTTITATTTVTSTKPAPLALGKFLHDSLINRTPPAGNTPKNNNVALSEVTSSDVTYSTPPPRQHAMGINNNTTPTVTSSTTMLSQCQSLNNIRVMEHHSPPKQNRNLSKSDLSLQRSEIFLENLCRSELVINSTNNDASQTSLQKVENNRWNDSYVSIQSHADDFEPATTATDAVSYELPPNEASVDFIDGTDASTIDRQFAATHKNNQSTPKKNELFTTKQEQMNASLPVNLHISTSSFPQFLNESNSCPVSPNKNSKHSSTRESKSCSLNEMSLTTNKQIGQQQQSTNSQLNQKTKAQYKRIKHVLRKSFRKSKNFVKSETKRLSQSFSMPGSSSTAAAANVTAADDLAKRQSDASIYVAASSLYLERLFALDEQLPVQQQLAQAVNICRQMPNLEISTEMVEAERLLLFSTLRNSKAKQQQHLGRQQNTRRYYIDAMRLPIKADASQDIFFNYFYIVTFECGGAIRSTQSVECQNGEALFRDCGIELDCACDLSAVEAEIRCEIFMLRLRKVSTLTLEPPKKIKLTTPSPASSSGSTTDIVSRFRSHASFSLKASDFRPYEYVECASRNAEKLCLRASSTYIIPITRRTKSTNLSNTIQLTARAEVRLPRHRYEAFLNVEDLNTQHNWNRRWCTLDGIKLRIWEDNQAERALLSIDLRHSLQTVPLTLAPRELCARPRAFCLQCLVGKEADDVQPHCAAVFFAADTMDELNNWLQHLNAALDFLNTWMQ